MCELWSLVVHDGSKMSPNWFHLRPDHVLAWLLHICSYLCSVLDWLHKLFRHFLAFMGAQVMKYATRNKFCGVDWSEIMTLLMLGQEQQ